MCSIICYALNFRIASNILKSDSQCFFTFLNTKHHLIYLALKFLNLSIKYLKFLKKLIVSHHPSLNS